jgi:hypothetical protein
MRYKFAMPSDEKNVEEFYQRLYSTIKLNHLTKKSLGKIGGFPILYLERKVEKPSRRVLIAAGFHGDETAGPWGLLNFLESGSLKKFNSVKASFLPLINPTGMANGTSKNMFDKSPNSGFCHNKSNVTPSYEGRILLENIDMLRDFDCFLSMHEDFEEYRSYLFTFENSKQPGIRTYKLRNVLGRYFDLIEDEIIDKDGNVLLNATVVPEGGGHIKNGIAFGYHDGSFEDRLFHEGVPFTACTDTPEMEPFELRVEVNYKLILSVLHEDKIHSI